MSIFRFKEFTVDQSGCAMKINTDGVLLGAFASMPQPTHILDIGTGTGVIALMLAQRYAQANIDAIDIDFDAAAAAGVNFKSSPYGDRMLSHHISLALFSTNRLYDLIVSNPPFFVDSLQSQDMRKRLARHTDKSFFLQILERTTRWLTPTGSLQLVLPVLLADEVSRLAEVEYGLNVQASISVKSYADQPPIRKLVSIGKTIENDLWPDTELVIYERSRVYTKAYRDLLADFFVAF